MLKYTYKMIFLMIFFSNLIQLIIFNHVGLIWKQISRSFELGVVGAEKLVCRLTFTFVPGSEIFIPTNFLSSFAYSSKHRHVCHTLPFFSMHTLRFYHEMDATASGEHPFSFWLRRNLWWHTRLTLILNFHQDYWSSHRNLRMIWSGLCQRLHW